MNFSNGTRVSSKNGFSKNGIKGNGIQGTATVEWQSVLLQAEDSSQGTDVSTTASANNSSSLVKLPATPMTGAIVRREPVSLEDTIRDEITGVVVTTEEPRYAAHEITLYGQSTGATMAIASDSIAEAVSIYLQQAEAYCEEKQWKKAFQACQEILKIAPATAEAYKFLGKILQTQGRVTDSMGFYAKAIMLRPNYPEVYSNLGSLYAKKGEWESAVEYYQKAIEQDKNFAVAYLNLSKVWKRLKRADSEMNCLATALRLEPKLGQAKEHYRVAQYFESVSDRESAIVFYRQTIEQAPTFVAAHQRLADLLEDSGDWQGAAVCYRRVLALNAAKQAPATQASAAVPSASTSEQTPEQTGGLLATVSEPVSAPLTDVQPRNVQPTNIQPASVQPVSGMQASFNEQQTPKRLTAGAGDMSLTEQAQRYVQAKNWPQAIACLQQALQQAPQSANLYRNLAQLFEQNSQPQQASESWYRSFVLDPEWPSAQQCFALGNRLTQQGNVEAAVRCYRQAIRVQPEFAEAYQALSRVLEGQGKTAEAAEVLQQFAGAAPVKK